MSGPDASMWLRHFMDYWCEPAMLEPDALRALEPLVRSMAARSIITTKQAAQFRACTLAPQRMDSGTLAAIADELAALLADPTRAKRTLIGLPVKQGTPHPLDRRAPLPDEPTARRAELMDRWRGPDLLMLADLAAIKGCPHELIPAYVRALIDEDMNDRTLDKVFASYSPPVPDPEDTDWLAKERKRLERWFSGYGLRVEPPWGH